MCDNSSVLEIGRSGGFAGFITHLIIYKHGLYHVEEHNEVKTTGRLSTEQLFCVGYLIYHIDEFIESICGCCDLIQYSITTNGISKTFCDNETNQENKTLIKCFTELSQLLN